MLETRLKMSIIRAKHIKKRKNEKIGKKIKKWDKKLTS